MPTIEVTETTDYTIEGDTGRIYVITRQRLPDGRSVGKHRRPIEPDADLTGEPAELKAIAERVRTPARLKRYKALQAAAEAGAE